MMEDLTVFNFIYFVITSCQMEMNRANQISVGCCLILSYYKVNLSQKTTTIVCVFVYCCFHVIFLFLFLLLFFLYLYLLVVCCCCLCVFAKYT